MRRHRASGMLSLSMSELDAAFDAGVSVGALFRNEGWAWNKVADSLDRRRANSENVALSRGHLGDRGGSSADRAAEAAARAELLRPTNALAFKRMAAEDAALEASLRAVVEPASEVAA